MPNNTSTNLTWLVCLVGVFCNRGASSLTRLGANDPEFNLRRDAAVMIRRNNSDNTIFASVVEPHGSYSPVSELSLNASSNIAQLHVVVDDASYTAVAIVDVKAQTNLFILAHANSSTSKQHQLKIDGKLYKWTGPYHFTEN